jgi:hypothetical protein
VCGVAAGVGSGVIVWACMGPPWVLIVSHWQGFMTPVVHPPHMYVEARAGVRAGGGGACARLMSM